MTLEEARNRMQKFADKHNMYLAHDKDGSCFGYIDIPIAGRIFFDPKPVQTRLFEFDVEPLNDDDWRTFISPRPKTKKDTLLQRALDKDGRRLVVAGYCENVCCANCALKDFCDDKAKKLCDSKPPYGWHKVLPELVNQAYKILTKEIKG